MSVIIKVCRAVTMITAIVILVAAFYACLTLLWTMGLFGWVGALLCVCIAVAIVSWIAEVM